MSAIRVSNNSWETASAAGPLRLQPVHDQESVQRYHLEPSVDRVGHVQVRVKFGTARLGHDGVIQVQSLSLGAFRWNRRFSKGRSP